MVILICDIMEHDTVDYGRVHATNTLYNLVAVSPRTVKDAVSTVLSFGAGVVVPDDAAKHTDPVLRVMRVLRLLEVPVMRTSEYLASLKTTPAAAHAASPTKHVAAVGQSFQHASPVAG